jgi:tyrosine-specific transport protein
MKAITGIMFIAATCIGSGMIALPITLVKIGIIPSMIVMFSMWFIIYYTALINLELNLQANKGMTLGALCQYFTNSTIQVISTGLLILLSYSLLSGYISIGSSVLYDILEIDNLLVYTLLLFCILCFPRKLIKKINNFLFIGVLIIIGILMVVLSTAIDWSNIPLFETSDFSVWSILLPVVFTSFGFQVIFHTLTDHYHCNASILKKVFFWGSLIPTMIYIIWTCIVLGAIHTHTNAFYQKMLHSSIDVNILIIQLSLIADNIFIQKLIMYLSFLAVTTSAIGIALGLISSIGNYLDILFENQVDNILIKKILKIIPPILSILPAYLILLFIPSAFVSIIGFAGMILSIIAIILPIYLLMLVKKDFYYPILKNKLLVGLSFTIGIIIMMCEVSNLL